MRPNLHKEQKGFTITELLISMVLVSIIMILIMMSFLYTYGAVIVDQTRAEMVRDSQLFLRKMTEDIRLSNSVRTTNILSNSYNVAGQWSTSDPANILIITQPASDGSNELIFDDNTGFPYQHEVIYYKQDLEMYRRVIIDAGAAGTAQTDTCPIGSTNCLTDIKLVDDLENLLFQFYDIDNTPTTNPALARSIDVTVNLRRQVFGNDVSSSNTIRITLRNE